MARTLLSAITNGITDRILGRLLDPNVPVKDVDAPRVAAAVAREVAPVIQNATNNEPLIKSRVFWGSTGSVLAAASDLAIMYATNSWDQQRLITDLVVLSGAVFALYGRIFGAKLKPLGQ